MPTAITASSGLVGSESVRHFVEGGYDVIGLDNDMRARYFGPSATTLPVSDALAEQHADFHAIDMDIHDAAPSICCSPDIPRAVTRRPCGRTALAIGSVRFDHGLHRERQPDAFHRTRDSA